MKKKTAHDLGSGENWVGANVVEDRLCIYLQTCANTNVEPSGHRNAQYDKKRGPCLRTLFGRRALRVAITTEECERRGRA